MVKVKAHAKINLFLEVTGRRPDGYHELATLFARIGVSDRLSFRKTAAPGIRLLVEGGPRELRVRRDNIVYKAAEAFFGFSGIKPAVEIILEKHIPVGAGLGGGSSDAASALLGLARLYRLPGRAAGGLMKLAAGLGSDVPFFMLGASMAEGAGRGEKLKLLRPAAGLPHIVLVYPGVPVYTREVYGGLKLGTGGDIAGRLKDYGKLRGLLKRGGAGPLPQELLFNRLEEAVLPANKAVRAVKERLLELGAEAALMSGSGASVFGLCRSRAKAARIASGIKCNRGYTVFLTKFC